MSAVSSTPTPMVPLIGAMTEAARDVNERLGQINWGARETRFLRRLEHQTFSQAGRHRMRGHERPGVWCVFDLADFADACQASKSQICHIRSQLVADGIILYDPATSRIEWNLSFDEWKPLQAGHEKRGGARPGSGAPSGNKNAAGNHTPKTRRQADALESIKRDNDAESIKPVNGESIRNDNENNQTRQRNQSDTSTPDCLPTALVPDSGDALRSEEVKNVKQQLLGSTHANTPTPLPSPEPSPTRLPSPTVFDRLAPNLAVELVAVVHALRRAPDWKPDDAKDAALVLSLAEKPHNRDVDWLYLQAENYVLWEGDEGSPPVKHNRRSFQAFCTGPIADMKLERFRAAKREQYDQQHASKPTRISHHQERANGRRYSGRATNPSASQSAATGTTGAAATSAGQSGQSGQSAGKKPRYDPRSILSQPVHRR